MHKLNFFFDSVSEIIFFIELTIYAPTFRC